MAGVKETKCPGLSVVAAKGGLEGKNLIIMAINQYRLCMRYLKVGLKVKRLT